MKSIKREKKGKRGAWLALAAILLIAGSAAGYFLWSRASGAASAATAIAGESEMKTSQVRQGSITISASGSGTLIAGQERSLSFSTSGTVEKLAVQVGDVVEKGDFLAELDGLEDLQADVDDAIQVLQDAQDDLAALQTGAAANLANAQLAASSAEVALSEAQAALLHEGMARCDQQTIEAKYFQWMKAQDALDALGDGGGNADYYLTAIVPAKNAAASAKAAYEYCAGFFAYEISASQANLTLAQAKLDAANAALAELVANNGVDPLEQRQAENQVTSAELALAQAEEKRTGATLTAPFDGTILSVAGETGDEVSTSAFITIADLAHPRIEFSIDETDLDKVFVGESATITFDAVPDRTFTGAVIRVDPALSTASGIKVVTGLIELDLSQETGPLSLPKGLNASIELLAASAEDALLVPLQALHDLGDGSFSVFVVENGQPRMRVVEVGIRDAASAEIKSGLKLGDVVTTGTIETN